MGVASYRRLLREAAAIGVLQVALGGGNPNQHPHFPELLKIAHKGFGIVPSYTTNGRGLVKPIIQASLQYCGAVAVSAHEPYVDLAPAVRILVDSGIRTNVHFVLDSRSVATAVAWLKEPPRELDGINALIFLNYKPVGRNPDNTHLLRSSPQVGDFFQLACSGKHPFRVGFDSCLVSGLASYTPVDPIYFDACEAARFSMFVSEDCLAFPCSFMTSGFRGVPVKQGHLQQIWQRSALFTRIREKLLGPNCTGCSRSNVCMGGCPVFRGINICDLGARTDGCDLAATV
jgi:radical SAM protein with 4Fe4S-binding SPASM domain